MSPIQVIARTADDTVIAAQPKNLTREKLMGFSGLARRDLVSTKGAGPKKVLDLTNLNVDHQAITRVLQWIADYDNANPAPLSETTLGSEEFPDLVFAYQASNSLRIDREVRGDEIRDHIYGYMHMAPLRWDEFAMIHEVLWFEPSMLKSAKHCTIHERVTGGDKAVPEMAMIEEWCREKGLWEEMLEIETAILKNREEKKQKKAEAKKAKFETNFPKLG